MRRLWYSRAVASTDSAIRRYETVGTEGGGLTFLGGVQEVLAQAWDETRDLQGGVVLPDFTDSRMHLLHYAMIQKSLSLSGIASVGEITERGRAWVEWDHPSYLTGMGWSREAMAEGRLMARENLDRISTDVPACMLRTCPHIGARNPVTLEHTCALGDVALEVLTLADFSNGVLWEDAACLYMEMLPQADDAYVEELIRLGQRGLNAVGITCVNSNDSKVIAGVDPIQLIGIFQEMEADGKLTVRVYEQCLVEPEDFERLQAVRSNPAGRESFSHVGPRKLSQDGSLGTKLAEMIDSYLNEPDDHSIPIYTEEGSCSRIRAAHIVHMDVAVHAIGDLALRKVCDAIKWVEREEPWPDHRHGTVHVQTTTLALLERMKALGLQAHIQPILIDADMNVIAEWMGEAYAKECHNWKATEDPGIRVDGGSDCPVESFNVLDNLHAAIARQDRAGTRVYLPEQILTVEQAVWSFTPDTARASRDEVVRGTLELGKQADLVVLDRDLFKIPHQNFNRVKVLETVLNDVTVCRTETLQSVYSLDHR